MEMAVRLGRQTRPELNVGICGEHAVTPEYRVLHQIGVDYVSCSPPYRVPIAGWQRRTRY
jgi:pyruvate,orthophosphate dikinase